MISIYVYHREGIVTKKIISIFLVLLIACSLTVPTFAASGLNKAEMQVVKMMDKGVKYSKDFYQYRNVLKNYFNRDNVSITQVQADRACSLLLDYYDSYLEDDPRAEEKFFNAFMYVLMNVGVRVMYDRANSTANLVTADGSLIMTELKLKNTDNGRMVSLNPIKQTGVSAEWMYLIAAAALFLVLPATVIIIKKKGRKNLNGDQ